MKGVVRVHNVDKEYAMGKVSVSALKGINLEFSAGLTLLRGVSGSGKTTMLNLIGGLDQVTAGSIVINGVDITKLKEKAMTKFRRENMGFIFQSFSLISVLSVLDNVEYPVYKNTSLSHSERKARAMSLIAKVGLKGFEKRFPAELSGGQQQRVAVARSLIAQPKLILADEPTANLDSTTGSLIIELLKDVCDEFKASLIISSHDQMVIENVKEKITLKDGRVVNS